MPNWLIAFIVGELQKYVTPELLTRLEKQAAQTVCCKAKALCDGLAPSGEKDALEAAVTLVASSIGVDLSKCAA